MKLRCSARTDVGRTRDHNEDSFGIGEGEPAERSGKLLVVCDGMGGHASGEVASRMAVDAILKTYYAAPSDDRPAALADSFKQANAAIYAHGHGNMGTTGVAALLLHDALHVANVGDSRAYLIRNGTIRQISRDHSLVADQLAAGLITPEQARHSNIKNVITRALGHQHQVSVDLFRFPLQVGDLILLCSDGLHGLVEDDELRAMARAEPPDQACQHLIDLANRRGGSDNITVVLACVDALDWESTLVDDEPADEHERITMELPTLADSSAEDGAAESAPAPPMPAPATKLTAAPHPERPLGLLGALLSLIILTVLVFVILLAQQNLLPDFGAPTSPPPSVTVAPAPSSLPSAGPTNPPATSFPAVTPSRIPSLP